MVSAAVQQIQSMLSAYQADAAGMGQQVTQAIKTASAKTGVSFSYLLNKAQQESGGDPNAKASTSTATGLFQFTGQTWLRMVKSYGTQYGIGNYAEHIKIASNGTAHVSDPTWKKAILGLRQDPQLSAEMAGELDKENGAVLQTNVGGKIGGTELYLAHFLGAGGASEFLSTMHDDPTAKAADILPDAAAANPSVFYNANGDAKSVAQIYQHFARKFDSTPATAPATMLASATPPSLPPSFSASSSLPSFPMTQSPTPYPAAPYVVADAGAARSVYVPAVASKVQSDTGNIQSDSSVLFATMVLAQAKIDDMPTTATTGTSIYKKNGILTGGAIV